MMTIAVEGFKGAVEVSPSPLAGGVAVSVRGGRGPVLLNADQAAKLVQVLAAAVAGATGQGAAA